MPIYCLLHNNPLLTVLSIVAIKLWLQKLSVVSHLSATGRGVGYLFHLLNSVFKTSRIAALGMRLSCSTNTICRSQLQSSGLAHTWAHYGIGVHRAHTQLNRFYLESTLCMCVTSRTRPSSRFFACNIKKLGERAWASAHWVCAREL